MAKRKSLYGVRAKVAGLLSLFVVVLLCCGCGPEDGNYSLSAKSELEDAAIDVTPAEYAQGTVTPLEYVVCSNPDVAITTDDEIDTSKVGTQSVHLELKMGFFSREEDVEVPVVDTAPPGIELSTDAVEVEMGEDVDLASLVEAVSDPVDGALEPVAQEPEGQGHKAGEEVFYDKGWYLIPGEVDTSEAGVYVSTVVAEDKHGNRSEAEIAVTVIDPLEGVTLTPKSEVLEYDAKEPDPLSLVECSDDEATVATEATLPMTVGTHDISYTLSKRNSTHQVDVTFMVKDTAPPVIKLKENNVSLMMGDKFDVASYIESVEDPVDGALKRVEEEPEAKVELAQAPAEDDDAQVEDESSDAAPAESDGQTDVESAEDTEEPLEDSTEGDAKSVEDSSDGKTDEGVESAAETSEKEPLDQEPDKQQDEAASSDEAATNDEAASGEEDAATTDEEAASGEEDAATTNEEAASGEEDVTTTEDSADSASSLPGEALFYDEGWYLVSGKVDVNKAGAYVVTVTAVDKHGNRAEEDIAVTIIDPLEGVTLEATTETIEYSKKKVDPLKLVKCSDDEAKLTSDAVAPNKIGEREILYTLAKGKSVHEEKVSFEVRDTHAPEIKLKKNKVSLNMGDAFKASKYIEYVKDPVDGKFQAVKKEPKAKGKEAGKEVFYDKGWYNISGKVDVNKVGKYNVVVKASDKHGNVNKKMIVVTVKDPLKGVTLTPKTEHLEYSNKKTDPTKLVTCSVKGAKLSAEEISLDKLGEKKVTFNVTRGSSKHKVDVTFNVRDTKAPVISFYSTEVAIDWGAQYDPYSNIEFVRDEVDGDLARVSEEPAENGDGWYAITGSYNTSVSSKYYLTVIACDKNGNRVEREFSLYVREKPVPQETSYTQPESNAHDYVLNTSTKKFHYPSCRCVKRMKASNRWDVNKTREEVVGMGYDSCDVCNP